MTLTPGTRLGPYEITAPLGAGGMGEVYRARDARLGRDVAVKVLPASLSSRPEVRARFEREAKTVSSLNHPHICTLHDVGREGDTDYLVMELVEGETLAQRLSRGALPSAEVLKLGTQIADALERAHRAGVIHRDLKPGNVMLTKSGAKLMDFGLARATGLAGSSGASGATVGAMTQSPTMAAPLTAEGTIVGTFQYMAPEQLEGKEADARSDIWALGCVLYEMATGKRAFEGRSQASLISAIMSGEPPEMGTLAPLAPPALERVVRQCLAKDPDDRWQAAGDVKRALEWSGDPSSGAVARMAARPARVRPRLAALGGALAAGALLASGIWLLLAPRGPRLAMAVLDLPTAPGAIMSTAPADVAISPDGRWLAYAGTDSSNVAHLCVRALDSPVARMIPETDRADHPFWSPDGRWIGYFTTGEGASLMKVPVEGGAPVKLCDIQWSRGGAWGKHGDILFVPAATSAIQRISASGGPVTPATVLDSARHETSHRNPTFLPDGDHFVYVALPATERGWTLYMGSLRSRAVKRIGSAMSAATWVEPGYLLYDRDGRFVAQKLDPGRLELEGDVIPLANTAPRSNEDATRIATGSKTGRIAMLRGDPPLRHLEWVGRAGARLAQVRIASGLFYGVVLSHDGRRVVLTRVIDRFAVQALRADLERGIGTALTDAREYNSPGCWSPDDRTLALSSVRGGGREEISLMPADGNAPPRVLVTSALQFKGPASWSPDGRSLVITQIVPGTARDLFVIDAARGGTPRPLATDPGSQLSGLVSPDGRWLVYDSDETGSSQVFVRGFPDGAGKLQLTTAGGAEPRWTRGGREVVFIGNDRRSFHALAFEPGREPSPDAVRLLFHLSYDMDPFGWDVTADGERFLMLAPDAAVRAPSTTVIVDWPALLERR
jgi:hypothetical protein